MKDAGIPLIPPDLMERLHAMVSNGKFKSIAEAFETCVRYYLERHGDESWRAYVREEIEAGLNETA